MAAKRELAGKQYRHELKYIISEGEHKLLSTRIKACLKQDYHAALNGGEYLIRSLYFDDPFDSALWEKASGIGSRDKFRIRIYNHSDDAIKLERKHKEGQYIKKDSVSISREDCDAIIRGNCECLKSNESPFAMQFYGMFKANHLRPKVLVDYMREPYVFPAEDVRITFDKNVRTAMRCTELFNPNAITYPVWDLSGCMILEVKFNESLPQYVQELLTLGAAQRTAASKYVFCRQFEF
ncbi:MAG: polyphosphate polymerase domain-containing protein [Christensenella sp.]|nr:polyphosphate polymerase domain-containing protein [Christensenella sp.]